MDKREQKKAAKKNGPMSVLPTNTSIMTFEVFSHTPHTPKKSSNNLISGTSYRQINLYTSTAVVLF